MIRPGAAVLPLVLFLGACGTEEPPVLTVAEVTMFAPLPGQPAGVAYFVLQNGAPATMALQRIESPDFTAVEMHTTVVEGGVVHMLPVDCLSIAERSEIEFTPGGMHLMLLGPLDDLRTGDAVTLDFFYTLGDSDTQAMLSVRAPVQAR